MKKLLALAMASPCACLPPAAVTPPTPAPTTPPRPARPSPQSGRHPCPHQEILEQVVDNLAEQGITLEIVPYTDYNTPNTAVEEGENDANYFQHITYMENFNAEQGTHLVSVGHPL